MSAYEKQQVEKMAFVRDALRLGLSTTEVVRASKRKFKRGVGFATLTKYGADLKSGKMTPEQVVAIDMAVRHSNGARNAAAPEAQEAETRSQLGARLNVRIKDLEAMVQGLVVRVQALESRPMPNFIPPIIYRTQDNTNLPPTHPTFDGGTVSLKT